jgi:uncharacterized membrane protein YphA (DoxX/SURF4 family)
MGDDFGKLILRLALGILILLHGAAKLKTGIGFLTPMVQGIGLPPWFAYGVFLGEVAGPIMIILGIFTRTGAFLIFANMSSPSCSFIARSFSRSASRAAGPWSYRECSCSRRSR